MNWQVVYEISKSDANELMFAGTLFFVIAAAALGLYLRGRRRGVRSGIAPFLAVMAVVVLIGAGIAVWDRQRLAAHLEDGSALRVEGPVSAYTRWWQDTTRAGEKRRDSTYYERIVVGGVEFSWALGSTARDRFTDAQQQPLVMRDGLLLRISYVEDVPGKAHERRIVRLEVADGSSSAPASSGALPGAPFPSVAPQ